MFGTRGVAFAVAVCSLLAARGAELKSGRIELLGTNVVELGTYPNTEDRTARIQIKNAGSGALAIHRVLTTCKCMRVDAFPESLEPGASGEVAVSILKNEVAGAFERVFYVESTDPDCPSLKIRVAGWAKPLFFVTCDAQTVLGPVDAGLVWTGTFTVAATEAGLSLGGVSVQNQGARCAFTIRTNQQALITYEVAQTVTFEGQGQMESTLTFPVVRPSGETAYPVRLTVEAVRKKPVRVVPDRILLSPDGAPVKRRMLVTVDAAAPLAAERLSCQADGAGVEVKVSLSKSGKAFLVDLTFPPGYVQGLLSGKDSKVAVKYGDYPAVNCPVQVGR
jgi:hypothetical protein